MPSFNSFKPYLLVIFFIISVAAAFLGGRFFDTLKPEIAQIPQANTNTIPKVNNQIFSKQTAEIKGVILSVVGPVITIQNSQNIKSEFKVADSVYVTGYTSQGNVNEFKSPQQIELNKQVIINLEKDPQVSESEMSYRVIAVSYIPSLPFVDPNAKPISATPSSKVR